MISKFNFILRIGPKNIYNDRKLIYTTINCFAQMKQRTSRQTPKESQSSVKENDLDIDPIQEAESRRDSAQFSGDPDPIISSSENRTPEIHGTPDTKTFAKSVSDTSGLTGKMAYAEYTPDISSQNTDTPKTDIDEQSLHKIFEKPVGQREPEDIKFMSSSDRSRGEEPRQTNSFSDDKDYAEAETRKKMESINSGKNKKP